jgi:hypothetical protein
MNVDDWIGCRGRRRSLILYGRRRCKLFHRKLITLFGAGRVLNPERAAAAGRHGSPLASPSSKSNAPNTVNWLKPNGSSSAPSSRP